MLYKLSIVRSSTLVMAVGIKLSFHICEDLIKYYVKRFSLIFRAESTCGTLEFLVA
jgi:hypothetical protein